MGKPHVNALTLFSRAALLLYLEGFSLGMAIWLLLNNRLVLLQQFVLHNQLPAFFRNQLMIFMTLSGFFFSLLIFIVTFFNKETESQDHKEVWFRHSYLVSKKSAPLLVSGLIPLIFYWKLWIDRELIFLILVSIVGLTLPSLIHVSLKNTSNRWFVFVNFLSETFQSLSGFRAFPLFLVVLGVAGYTLFFSYFTIAAHHNLRTMAFDMGIENNLMWNLTFKWLQGDPLTPLFKTTPFAGPNGSTLGWHTTFIAFLLVPFYALYPDVETLLVIQAFLISATAIPLFLWARIHINEGLAAFLGIAYLFYSPVHGSNLYDFHWLNLGPFFIVMTLYFLEAKKDILGAFFILLTLAVREDVAPAVAIIGTYFLLSGRRPKLGLAMAFIGTIYFLFIKIIFMPYIAGKNAFIDAFKGLLPVGETSFLSVMKTVVGNPAFTLGTLLEQQKLIYLLHFFTPLAFIPLMTPWFILFFIPGFFFSLLSTGYLPFIQPTFQYTSHFCCYFFITAVLALSQLRKKTHGYRNIVSLVLSLSVCLLTTSQMFGAFFQRQYVKGGFGIFQFETTQNDRVRRESVKQLIRQIPPTAAVAATGFLNPQVSSRADAYVIVMSDAEWLLVEVPAVLRERPGFKNLFQEQNFGVVDIRPPFALLKKGYDKGQNEKFLQMLGS